jgi:hypothetical protein
MFWSIVGVIFMFICAVFSFIGAFKYSKKDHKITRELAFNFWGIGTDFFEWLLAVLPYWVTRIFLFLVGLLLLFIVYIGIMQIAIYGHLVSY